MAMVYNRYTTGLFENGGAQNSNNINFTTWNYTSSDGLSNGGCFAVDYNIYGSTGLSDQFIPVDLNKQYQMAVSAKGTANNYLGNPPGGHLGFACYDENYSFIDLRNCKDIGDTQLTRAAAPGDTTIYVADASGWSTSATTHQRALLLFGGNYPYSGGYTRHVVYANGYNANGLTNLGGGEWSVTLPSGLPTYSDALDGNNQYPVGTYMANGRAGGTYNYAFGAPNHPIPDGWITYSTGVMSGTSRNSGAQLRYGTKYIKFMNLRNYNTRTQSAGDSPRYLLDNIILVERPNGIPLPDSFFSSDRIK